MLGSVATDRLRDYETATTLWTDAVRKSPRSPTAHNNLAIQLILDQQRPDGSLKIEIEGKIIPPVK